MDRRLIPQPKRRAQVSCVLTCAQQMHRQLAVLPVGVRQRMDHAIVHSDVSQNRLVTPHALEHDHSLYARWML